MQIPFYSTEKQHQPIRQHLLDRMAEVLDSNWYISGNNVAAFEAAYALYCRQAHCVGVSNGLDALFLCLKSLDIGEGDEVILPSHCFVACVLAITHTGATPIFVEPDPKTYTLDVSSIETVVTDRTKAILAVHMYGHPCQMDALMALAEKHQLWVIEDTAQAHGAQYAGRIAGSWGHMQATSFYPTKNLAALGDAGAITTQDEWLAARIRMLQNYGSSQKYHYKRQGWNKRLDEIQAAILQVKLTHLDSWNQQRQHLASAYLTQLAGIPGLVLPQILPQVLHAWHLFVVRTTQRTDLQSYLKTYGIDTLIHYPIPVHLQPAYRELGFRRGDFPVAEEIADTCLSLPLYPGLTDEEIEYIAEKIRQFFNPR